MPDKKLNKGDIKKIKTEINPSDESSMGEIKPGNNNRPNKYYLHSLIILLCFIVYGNTIANEYALDDSLVITQNKYTQSGIKGIGKIFSTEYFKGCQNENLSRQVFGSRYRPLSMATFALEYQFFGLNPHISHLVNVILFSLTCLLIFILLLKILINTAEQKPWISLPFVATLIYLAHPIHTEVVANIKSRDEILSLLFSLLTFYYLLKYLDSGKLIFIVTAASFFFIALLSKETALVFLIVIPLAFYFFTNHSLKKIFLSMSPLFAVMIIFVAIRQIIVTRGGDAFVPGNMMVNDPFSSMNVFEKYATITYTFGLYLKLLFYPDPLTWDYYPYHIPPMEWPDIKVVISLLVFLFLIFYAFKGLKGKKFYSWCILLFLVPLSLTLNIIFPVGGPFMGERFLYTPSLGFALAAARIITASPHKISQKTFNGPWLILIPILFLYSFKTITRNKDWKNDNVLIEKDVKTSANSEMSNAYYGYELYRKADSCRSEVKKAEYYELALYHCDKANKINPDIHVANLVLGNIYLLYKNDVNRAEGYLDKAYMLNPGSIETCISLGSAYERSNRPDKAIEILEKALKIEPENAAVLANLGLICNNKAYFSKDIEIRTSYYEYAMENCNKAIQIDPHEKLANFVLGSLFLTYKNDPEKSIHYLTISISSDPYYIASYNILGFAYYRLKEYDKAIEVFEKGLKIAPREESFYSNLSSIYKNMGKDTKRKGQLY